MILSHTTRRDPTQTKTPRGSYRRDLVRLFRLYRRDALRALEQSAEAGSRMLAAADIDLIRLDEILRALGASLVTKGAPITRDHALQNFTAGTAFGTKQLNRVGVEAVIGTGPADWRVIDALKVRNLSALRGVTDEMNRQIIRELSDGINMGESVPKLAKRISGRVDSIGITRATTIAHHETMKAFNQGAELRYAQAGVETLEWLSAHDPPRVCEECLALDGTTFRIKSNHIRPPDIHIGCRCTTIPVLGKPKIVTKEDTVRSLTDNIATAKDRAVGARREYKAISKINARMRDDVRMSVRLAPSDTIKAITGKAATVNDLERWHDAVAIAERKRAHFLTPDEIKLLGKWGKKRNIADNIFREQGLSGTLSRYDNELDDLLMELRSIKRGRYMGTKAAITKYEKRIWNRDTEELYLLDRNGQKIWYSSSTLQGASSFTDVGDVTNGLLISNRIDGSIVLSKEYMELMARYNLAEMRMVAPGASFKGVTEEGKTYILRKTGKLDQKYYDDVIAPAYRRALREIDPAHLSPEQINLEAWKRVSRECDKIELNIETPAPLVPRKTLTQHEREVKKAAKARREEDRLKDVLKSISE